MTASGRSRVGLNTAVGAVSRLAVMAFGFAVTPFLFHSLGEELFGLYAVIGSLQAYYGVLDLGIGGSLVRFMAFHAERQDYPEVRQIATFGVLFYAGLALVLLPIVLLLSGPIVVALGIDDAFAAVGRRSIVIVFLLWVGGNISSVFASRLVAVQRIDVVSVAGIAGAAAFTGAVILGGTTFRSLDFVWLCAAVQLLVTTAIVAVRAGRLPGGMFASPSSIARARMRELLQFGAWTQINSVSALLNLEADKVVISRYLGIAEVAPYQIGNRLALLNRSLPLQLLAALLPDFTAKVSRGLSGAELVEAYGAGLRALMLATLAITGFIAAAAGEIVRLWIGAAVPGAAAIAAALVLSYAVNNLTGLGTLALKAFGRPKYETYYAVLSAGLNVGLTVALIPRFGLLGVVAGTIIGNVVGSALFIVLFHRLVPIPWWPSTGRWLVRLVAMTVLAGGAAAGCLRVAAGSAGPGRVGLLLELGLAGVAYLLVFYGAGVAFRFWSAADLALFGRVAGRVTAGVRRLRGGLP